MNSYSIALFLHIVGALGFFFVLGLEWAILWEIRKAILPKQVQTLLEILKSTNWVGVVSIMATIITGLYMMLTVWGSVPWILVVLGALVLEFVISVVLTGPRVAAIGQALDTEKGSVSQAFHNLANHPMLWISIHTRVAIILTIVFLKIAKPDLGGSLLSIGVAILLGLASALPIPRLERAQAGSTD